MFRFIKRDLISEQKVCNRIVWEMQTLQVLQTASPGKWLSLDGLEMVDWGKHFDALVTSLWQHQK